MILQKLHTAFSHLIFYDEGHRYLDSRTDKFIPSVTQTIGKYVKSFNKEYWTLYKALERAGVKTKKHHSEQQMYLDGVLVSLDKAREVARQICTVTPQQIGHEWESLSIQGKAKGTSLHKYAEGCVYGKRSEEGFVQVDKWVDDTYIKGDYFPIRMEIIVGNDIVCGQSDNLSGYRSEVFLKDYKTDKKFRDTNPWENFLPPFEHLQQCEYNKYALQMSMYSWILEDVANIKVDHLQAIWFPKHTEEYHIIDLPYLKKEAEFLCRSKVLA